ncbi:MAG: hypothetical protein NVS9B15_10290 [Acidobacteriaceae bacterium]
MRNVLILIAGISAAPWLQSQPNVASVQMSNFKFSPKELDLSANNPVVLQLVNDSSGGHSFAAPEFFASSRVDARSAALIRAGRIEVPAHRTVQVQLVPVAGQFPLKCSHTLHSALGMKGIIVVR